LALLESEYPAPNNQPSLNQLEWIQYQLDISAELEDVIDNSSAVQIVPVATPVHYMICDRWGNVGILEFIDGELILYQGKDITIPVCSNMPYGESRTALQDYQGFGGGKPVPTDWRSMPDIIAIAGSRVADYPEM